MNYTKISIAFALQILALLSLLRGCSIPVRLPAVPQDATTLAEIPDMPGIRYLIGTDNITMKQFMLDAKDAMSSELTYRAKMGQQGPLPPANFLAISGGGDDGAYGAGLLCGWSATGTRPEFKLVTGISTGALIAPFAFLGSKYDAKLKEVYTNSSPKDILEARGPLAAVFNDALADNKPLWSLLQKHITPEMLQEIAEEYKKGRILLIASTNLDSRRPVIWNMTKIAASGHPQALDLFRKLMMTSAAIPGAFPPTMIDVVANGKQYQEMHVDGGAIAQVFVYPPSLKLKEAAHKIGIDRERNLYVIRNARLDPDWSEVERRTLSIAGKAISSLIRTQGIGDLYRIYLSAQRDGLDYNLAFIPSEFHAPHKEDFDKDYMQKLFLTGYEAAEKGYPWAKTPPGY
ncbi:MAG: patatin-like phospholipase family protein [Methylobacter sp.]